MWKGLMNDERSLTLRRSDELLESGNGGRLCHVDSVDLLALNKDLHSDLEAMSTDKIQKMRSNQTHEEVKMRRSCYETRTEEEEEKY